MSFLANAQNTSIQSATFNAIVQGDVHHYSGSQLSVIWQTQRGFEILQRHVAQAAFHDSLERSDPPRCHPLTRRAILDKIMKWISDPDNLELFIWIFGPAGGGKTAIAQTIAEMCAAAGSLAASFFFSRTVAGRKDFRQLVPTLAYQLALHMPEIREDISLAIEHDPAVFSRALTTQMQVLILQPLNAAANDPLKKETTETRKHVVVLDGFDECGDGRSQREVLEVLSAHVKLLEVPIIFLITSRPEQQIRVAFSKPELDSQTLAIALDEDLNPDDDIRVFLEEKFRELKINHPSGSQLLDQWPSEDDICQIVQKSSGQFIYAATVMKFMDCHRHPPVKRLKIILGAAAPSNKDSPYAELDALYQQLFQAIDDLEGAMDLLTLLVLQERDSYYLTVDFSESLLAYDQGDVLAMLSDMHAFVHVPKPDDPYDAIRIHHASLPDFLFDRSRSGTFFIDSRNGHANITTHWIKFVQRSPLPDLGAHTVVRPRGHDSIIVTVERIIEHCTKSRLTDELCKALLAFNLEAHLILYPGSAFKELIQSLSSFLQWLKPETPELNDARLELYHYHMTHIDRWILNQLSLFPDAMRSNLSAAFIFEDKFSSSPGALFDILSHKFDPITNSFSKVEYSTANKDFWFICQEFGGALLFDIFKGFFTDSSRSSIYVVHERAYAELACTFLDHIRLGTEGKNFAQPWSHHRYHYVPNGNRYRTEGTDEVLIRAALEFLPKVLSRSPQNADLVQGLKNHVLQLKSTDPLHEKRLEAAIASFEYLKKVDSAFEKHSHKPDYNVCIVCLLQPSAIPAPAPLSRSSLNQAVAPRREVESTAERVTFTGKVALRLRWIPPALNDSELEETATPSWMFQSGAYLQQMVESADLPQMVEGDDLPQVIRPTTEPVTLTELYLKWILPKREDSGINKTVTPNAFPKGSSSRGVGTTRAVEVAAEPITLTKAHPGLISDMQDDSQLDETATPNSFSGSSTSLDPKRVVKITAEPVTLTEPHPKSIPATKNETATPTVFSKPSSHRTVDSKRVVEAGAEPVTFTKAHPKLIPAMPHDSQLDEPVTSNAFSNSSPHGAVLDPERVIETTAEPVGLTEPQVASSSLLASPKRMVETTAEPVTPTELQLDKTVTPNAFSTLSTHKRGVEIKAERVVQLDKEAITNGFFTSSLQNPKRVVGITAEPLALTEPQLHEIATPNRMVDITAEPVFALTKPQIDEAASPDGFSRSSPLLGPKRVVENTAEPVSLTELKIDETAISNGFSMASPLLDPKRVVEITSEPTALTEPQFDEASTFSLILASKRMTELTAEPVTLTELKIDETATSNTFSVDSPLLAPKRVVEITTEPVTLTELQLDETASNGFSTSSPLLAPKRVVEITAEPVALAELQLDEVATLSGFPVVLTESQVDKAATPNGLSTPSSRLDPKQVVEIIAELVTLTEPHPRLIPVAQDETETRDEVVDPKQAVEVATEPVTRNDQHPTPRLILPTLKDSELSEIAVPNMRLASTSTLLIGFVIVTITLMTLHQNWARTPHL